METLEWNFTPDEFNSIILELLMATRLEQMRNRAFMDTLVETTLTEKQKMVFKPLFKQHLKQQFLHLKATQSVVFSEIIEQALKDLDTSEGFHTGL